MDQRNGQALAKAEEALWRKRYETFVRLYPGRDDVVAERRDGRYVAVPGAGLTFERFVDHARMGATYAIYNKDDAGKVGFGMFDLDILPRDQGWEKLLLSMGQKKRETALIMQTLMEMGLERRNMLVEFPTVGFHLLLPFDQPVPAKALKTVMGLVLAKSSLEGIPFYPRQVNDDAPWGDRVQLPLRVNLNTNHRSNFIRDLEAFDPENYSTEPDYAALDGVAPIDPRWVQSVVDKYGLKE